VIRFDDVSVRYDGAARAVLRSVDLTIEAGEVCLVTGATGAGKSTLLGTVNGLVPHFTGGTLFGRVTVGGRDTAAHPPRELADLVGVVGQDPLDGFVADTVEEELAHAVTMLGLAPSAVRDRVEEALELLGLTELRDHQVTELSGGQQQRVAIGAAITVRPRVLVLDEPTSALDPHAARDLLKGMTRLVRERGVTVLLAEHRLERVAEFADRVIHLPGDGTLLAGTPAEVFRTSSAVPPVVELGRLAGWSPLPLSVARARECAGPLRERLAGREFAAAARTAPTSGDAPAAAQGPAGTGPDLRAGEITALMGPGAAGKSALLRRVGPAPRTTTDLLRRDTVDEELAGAGRPEGGEDTAAAAAAARAVLDRLVPGVDGAAHPRDLSEGQRQSLVLAVHLASAPGPVVLLDEPTRGLDSRVKDELGAVLRELTDSGRAVLISTHDVEFVARAADRVVVLDAGAVTADGPAAEVLASVPMFTPQVGAVLHPLPCLTVAGAAAALAEESALTPSPAPGP
jgi:energy-coupling factor transport system ATP-binding protein